MLLYHFNTRDQLVLQALQGARRRQQQLFGELLAPRTGVPYATVLTEAWDGITAPALRPYLRLFGQLHDLPPDRTPWTEFRVRSITDWLPTIEAGLRADGHPDPAALATAVIAVVRGLLQDLGTTADHQRTTDALRAFAKLLPSSPGSRTSRGRLSCSAAGVPAAELEVSRNTRRLKCPVKGRQAGHSPVRF